MSVTPEGDRVLRRPTTLSLEDGPDLLDRLLGTTEPLDDDARSQLRVLLDGRIGRSFYPPLLDMAVRDGDVRTAALLINLGAAATTEHVFTALRQRQGVMARILLQHPTQPVRAHQGSGVGVPICDRLFGASEVHDFSHGYLAIVRREFD